MSDPINPDHYKKGGIETFDVIKAKQTQEETIGYCKGNQRKVHKGQSKQSNHQHII